MKLIITSSILLFSLFLVACVKTSSKKTNVNTKTIKTTWKCLGFSNNTNHIVKDINPMNNRESYILVLKEDGSFDGVTSFNTIGGIYTVDTIHKKIKLTLQISTRAMETPDGNKYVNAIKNVTSYQFSPKGELMLFYTAKDYLLFKKV